MGRSGVSLSKLRVAVAILLFGVVLTVIEKGGLLNPLKDFAAEAASPIQIVLYQTYQNFSESFQGFLEIGSLRARNVKLEVANSQLTAENSRLKDLEAENQALRVQLGVGKLPAKILQVARIIGFGTAGSRDSLLIDKGSADKLVVGDIAVVKNIYVGTIVEETAHSAQIRLLQDPAVKIPAVTEDGAIGIAVGEFGTEAHLTNVVQDDKLHAGDLVLSSGEALLPQGLILGRLSQIQKVNRELFQDARIDPLLDITKLKTLFIMSQK